MTKRHQIEKLNDTNCLKYDIHMIYIINVVLSGMKLLFLYLKCIGMFLKARYQNKLFLLWTFKRKIIMFFFIYLKMYEYFSGKIY